MTAEQDIEKQIFDTFAAVAGTLGYSPLHGRIIGALIVHKEPMSLRQISKETGYSTSMISLSLDLLEMLGTIKKIKKTGDRQLYVEFHGDLLEALKNAIVFRVKKAISTSLSEFEDRKAQLKQLNGAEKQRLLNTITILEKHIKRMERYVDLLSGIRLPSE